MKTIIVIIGLLFLAFEAFQVPNGGRFSWGWLGLLVLGIALFFL